MGSHDRVTFVAAAHCCKYPHSLPHWCRFIILLRPYSSIISLLAEVLISCVELVLFVFLLVVQQHADAPSDPWLVAIIVLFIGVRHLQF